MTPMSWQDVSLVRMNTSAWASKGGFCAYAINTKITCAGLYIYILKEAPVVIMAGVQLVVHVRSLCVYFTFD